ncbi:MAG: apolipoprotein N-acyltransferase [Saprospiraceae bacterium]|jgi:apolipoprotein N-acyltransferase
MRKLLQNPYFLSFSGAFLLWAGWPSSYLFPLLFVGMAAFLLSAKRMITLGFKGPKYFLVLFLALLLWNVATTWWIKNATWAGMIMAVIGNTLLMYLPFLAFRWGHKAKVEKLAMLTFGCCWMAFEYLHHNWSLSWPWITLGNGMAKYPSLIQWYEYTGTGGGSLWILIGNVMLFNMVDKGMFTKSKWIKLSLLIVVPILVSVLVKTKYSEGADEVQSKTVEVVILQPNFNTYTQKPRRGDDYIPLKEQWMRMIEASKLQLTQKTEYLIWPETAISGNTLESNFENLGVYHMLHHFLSLYPNLTLVTGIDTYEFCEDQRNPTQYASYATGAGFYEPYNAALMMTKDTVAFYHKSKFVPGAEQVPFPWLIKPLEMLLGGVGFGHYFGQEKQDPFISKNGIKASAGICYESIYGEHMAEFVNNGAQLQFVITNDDWWHDTEGHRQHYDYARLRVIETRKPLARSGNTGFSGFFNVLGNDSQKTAYRVDACIKQDMKLNNYVTFYTKHGDYIGRIASFFAVCLLLSVVVRRITIKAK